MTAKQEVLAVIKDFPEDASLEEISEKIRVFAAVRRSRASVAAGKFKTQEQVREIFDGWAKKWQK